MSQWRGQIENIEEPEDVLALVGRYYHVPALLLLVGFMLWSRVRNWQNFVVEGQVLFSGNDAWYHYRTVTYTVQHWPETMPFDPWTGFPEGAHSSQFGTLFDQLVATAALIVGLGNPSDHTIRMVHLFAPAVIGTAVALPTYYIGKRASDRLGGVIAVVVLALAGSTFVSRSSAGFSDHHVAEVFFQALAVVTTMIAVSVANREKPVYELFTARDVASLRRPVGWALLAGVTIALYIWTWPPGVLLLGILGVYYAIELSSSYAHGESPEHVAITGAVSMVTAGVLTLASIEEIAISATSFNVVQPMLAFAVAAGCVFMAWLAREWDDRDAEKLLYPAAIAGIAAVLVGVVAVALPDLFDFFLTQVRRVIGFGTTETAATVGEAQPMSVSQVYDNYRFTVIVAGVGALYVLARHFFDKPRPELTLLTVYGAFILSATLTQRRFDYYLVVPIAGLTGYTVASLADFADLTDVDRDVETYQVLTLVAVLLVVFAPMLYPASLALGETRSGPAQGVQSWEQGLDWMESNTPAEGNLGGADSEMGLYGTFQNTDDYEYEDGFYGVISWWDYGHWITSMSERIPVANPFQQNADEAANFLLSTNETQADQVRQRLSDGNGTESRYVMVDWKMVTTETRYQTSQGSVSLGGKYFAPFQFYSDGEIDQSEYYQGVLYETGQQSGVQYRTFMRHQQNYYNSTAVRLYRFHGSSAEPAPLVLDWELQTINGQQYPVSNGIQQFDNMSAAREYVQNDTTSQIGGIGPYPEERVPAMEHYRLVDTTNSSAVEDSQQYLYGLSKTARGGVGQSILTQQGLNQQLINALHQNDPAWVKTFERVPGATIEGEGPANTTVTASVEMNVPASNSTFAYTQQAQTDENGEFTMTVPYSTTGYDEVGTEDGYTEPEVRANGSYTIRTNYQQGENGSIVVHQSTVNVSEEAVIGEDESPIQVTLEESEFSLTQQNQDNSTASGDGSGSDTAESGDSTEGEQSTDEETATNESADGGAAIVAPQSSDGQLVPPA